MVIKRLKFPDESFYDVEISYRMEYFVDKIVKNV